MHKTNVSITITIFGGVVDLKSHELVHDRSERGVVGLSRAQHDYVHP